MGPRLATAVGVGRAPCHVLDAKFEPGVRGILLYELGNRLVRGDLLPTSEPAAAGLTGTVPPGLRLSLFPVDPELPALADVVDPRKLGPALSRALSRTGGTDSVARASRCRITLLRYRPGKRATVSVAFGDGGRYIAKAYHDPVKAAAVSEEAAAPMAPCSDSGTLRLAPVLGHLPDLAVVVQGQVSGVPLAALLGGPGGPVRGARTAVSRAARGLAEFHETTARAGRPRPVERELRRFGERSGRIRGVAPYIGTVLAEVAERLLATHPRLPHARLGPVHGDCKPSQFLLTDRHVYLMDLDHLGVSDQATDVGTFLASLRQLAVRRSLSGASRDPFREAAELSTLFLDTYLEVRGDDGCRLRARWQEAVALERKALRAFARAPRSALAGALAAHAHRCLDELVEET